MPLSDDQRAMLRLLAQREQGYDDIAALMGLSVDEVRAKVRAALAQLEDEGLPPPPLPVEPPVAMTAEAPEPVEPEPPAIPEPPPAPTAPGPTAPGPTAKPVAAEKPPVSPPPPPKRPPSGPPKLSLPGGKGPRAAIAAGIAVVILVVVVLLVSGGGGDSATTSASTQATTESEAQNTSAANGKAVTKAVLSPVAGGSATGVAIFGRVKKSLALQVEVEGLEPTTKGTDSYTVWLAQSPQRMLPLASTQVEKDGRIGAQFEVPVEVLAYLANETFKHLVVTRTVDATLEAALAKATKEERSPAYTGTAVLEGTVTGPIVGAQIRKEEEEKEEKGK